jgi:hypothetical protein
MDGSMKPQYTLFAGASNLAAGLAGGFSGLAAGHMQINISCKKYLLQKNVLIIPYVLPPLY